MLSFSLSLCAAGKQVVGPGKQLFGHACANGGVVLRPGTHHKVLCGHARDHGAYCGKFCPSTTASSSVRGGRELLSMASGARGGDEAGGGGARCAQAWAPEDVAVYLRRETAAYREDPGWGHYKYAPIHAPRCSRTRASAARDCGSLDRC